MMSKPEQQHEWLRKFVGEWTYECDAMMGPDKPPEKFSGTESVRSIGGLWVVLEGRGEMPGGGQMASVQTIGYDAARGRFVGTWIGSMMTHLWVYEGALDPAGRVLTLNTEGPSCAPESAGTLAKFRDVTEFKSDDHRVLTSSMTGDDGALTTFMTAHYRRKK